MSNSIVWGNTDDGSTLVQDAQFKIAGGGATVNHSCVQDNVAGQAPVFPGTENIDLDPQFIDPLGANQSPGDEDDNLRLSIAASSPCIDAGDNDSLPTCDEWDVNQNGYDCNSEPPEGVMPYDLDKTTRITPPESQDGDVDMGAYEFNCDSDADCDDYRTCTINTCLTDFGFCVFTPNDAACDDGLCETENTCDPANGDPVTGCVTVTPEFECHDGDVCTWDHCLEEACVNEPNDYGDVDHNGVRNLFDIFCIIKQFSGEPYPDCEFESADIHPCTQCVTNEDGNDVANLFDVLRALDAIIGIDWCCTTGACCTGPECTDSVTREACVLDGGEYQGDGTTCGGITCTSSSTLPGSIVVWLVSRARAIVPNGLAEVEAFGDEFIDLRGYEIAVSVTGGTGGTLTMANMFVDDQRSDYVFFGHGTHEAFDLTGQRLANTLESGGEDSSAQVYLGTFVLRASQDAQGTFTISAVPGDGTSGTLAADSASRPMVVNITGDTTVRILEGLQ
jgi:hypothetical protein